jgi:hypothetical protein
MDNLIERVLDIGNVYVETPGNNPDVTFYDVDHPFVLMDLINTVRGHKDLSDKIKKENDDNTKLHLWLSRVAKRVEETAKGRGAPDLRRTEYLNAIAIAQEFGLDVVVSGEAQPDTSLPPGCVVQQSPPPGTLMEVGSKIEIVLSKTPVSITIPANP